jgi:hypothetical protein
MIIPLPNIKYGFVVKPGHLEDSYILGKFFLIIDENGYATIIDQYKFYPWNSNDLSFSSSDSNTDWAPIQMNKEIRLKKIPVKYIGKSYHLYLIEETEVSEIKWDKLNPIKISNSFSFGRVMNIDVYIHNHLITINISIQDKLFYFLGRLFNVRTNKFKLPEKVFKDLKIEWKREYRSYKEKQEYNKEEQEYNKEKWEDENI